MTAKPMVTGFFEFLNREDQVDSSREGAPQFREEAEVHSVGEANRGLFF